MDISKELCIKLVQVLNFPSPYPFQLLIGGHHLQHENLYIYIWLQNIDYPHKMNNLIVSQKNEKWISSRRKPWNNIWKKNS